MVLLVALAACDGGGDARGGEASAAPSGALTKDDAQRQIAALFSERGALCTWQRARQRGDALSYSPHVEADEACATWLEERDLAKRGGCIEPGCTGGCCTRELAPAGAAKMADGTLRWRCGELTGFAVSAISTDGPTATVLYERGFSPSDAAKTPKACDVTKPFKGIKRISIRFRRFDDGAWKIEPQSWRAAE